MNNAPLDRRFLLGGLAGVAGVSALAAMSKAGGGGPLNPPAGAVASTGKTLGEVEPRTAISAANTPGDGIALYRITQPGSYYLTGDVQGVAGRSGIAILADNVTLDLNGFALLGVTGSGDGVSGSNVANATVLNGVCRGWDAAGISFFGGSVQGVRIQGVTAAGNTTGIYTERLAEIIGCTVLDSGSIGINCGDSSFVTACFCCGNPYGIRAGLNARIVGNTVAGAAAWAAEGTGPGLEAIRVRLCGIVSDNSVRSCAVGIRQAADFIGQLGACVIERNASVSCATGYKVEGTHTLLRANTSILAGIAHYNVVTGNYAHVVVPTANPSAFTNAGGVPFLPAGADPTANLILA